MLIEYLLQLDEIIIRLNMPTVNIFENNIPPNPLLPRKNLTIVTFEKLIKSELLLNLIPAKTAQKTHTPVSKIIKVTKLRCLFNDSNNEYENFDGIFILIYIPIELKYSFFIYTLLFRQHLCTQIFKISPIC